MKFRDFLESRQKSVNRKPRLSYQDEKKLQKTAKIQKTTINGWTITIKIHQGQQQVIRRNDLSQNEWEIIHSRQIKQLMGVGFYGHYLIYSKEYEQGYIIEANPSKKYFYITTVLPKGRKHPNPGTDLLVVEKNEIVTINVK